MALHDLDLTFHADERLSGESWERPMASQIDLFLELLLRSKLAVPTKLVEWCADFPVARRDTSALDDLCTHLVNRGALTRWQCDKLRVGKFRGFFQDGYCLQDQIEKDEVSTTYLCRHVDTGRHVAMKVKVLESTESGRIEYDIVDLPDESSARE
ncbi:MAG: hypothetical protein AB7G28_12590 [Pirellulales bacterium]